MSTPRLWATSDLHVGYDENRRAVEALPEHPGDWLIVAGDTGETPAHLEFVLGVMTSRFAKVFWTPGNHELWTPRQWPPERRGAGHYDRLIAICRRFGVLTPEDPYASWPGDGPPRIIAPVFTLFDYSFRPESVSRENAVAWAAESGVRSADEDLLGSEPYPTRDDWCAARIEYTEGRLAAVPAETRIILAGHFPFRRDLAVLPRIPRFSIWCGTTRTGDWHRRFNVERAVYGHLHLRGSKDIDGVRFDEVSLGYPQQWDQRNGLAYYLRRLI
jgi:hypothetical protein